MKNKLIPFLIFSFLFQHTYADEVDQNINFLKDPSRKESIVGGFYEGRFSDGTLFQMTLFYLPSSSASYQYPKQFNGETIGFGEISLQGDSFKLSMADEVRSSDNKVKILYKEEFVGKLSKDKKTASGIWIHIAGNKKKTLNFSMQQLAAYKEISETLPPTANDTDSGESNNHPSFNARFPILQDPEINKQILKDANICDYNQECNNDISIEGHYNNLLSLRSGSWGYDAGQPHGYDSFVIHNYVMNRETSHEVFLDYFLKTSSSCLSTVSNLVTHELGKLQLHGEASFINKDNYKNQNFLPTPIGLEFLFNQYEVGGYIDGEPTVFISKKQLGDCLIYLPETK